MKYDLLGGVWELTMACNMRCKHCGSSCKDKQEDELTTEEALDLCDQLADLGMKFITLSGGELTLRNDWHIIGKRLTDHGIATSMITNGWLLDDDMIARAKNAGFQTIGISIDGLQKTHDAIRRIGSYERDLNHMKQIRKAGLNSCVVTTVHEGNFAELEGMYQEFLEAGVNTWQLQIALPMGNFTHHKDLYLKKERTSEIIDFCYSKIDGNIAIYLADCIGYYTQKESLLRKKAYNCKSNWQGCPAGKHTIGILCNGDIIGCTSIREKKFVEGNIRKTSLKEIWESPNSFKWNRELKKQDLKGFCHDCIYGDACLGGCSNTRYTYNGDIHSENEYCAYHYDMRNSVETINSCDDIEELRDFAYSCAKDKHYQLAILAAKKLISLDSGNLSYQDLYAFLHYQIQDYATCIQINEEILKKDNSYNNALKGLGLAVFMTGDYEKGLQLVRDSLEHGTADNYSDLYGLLKALAKDTEAESVKQEALDRFSVDITKVNN